MSLYQKAVAGLLFPLHEKLKGHDTIAVHRAMEQSQWLAPEAMAQLQRDNLRRFLVQIGGTVPYYQALFAELGFNPESVDSVADLQRLPLLDKATIRAHTEQLKARDARGLKRFNTGGSSGEPLIFYLGNERVSHDVAAKRRATRWWGVDIGDREIVVWGSPIELGSQDRVRLLRDKLFRTELLSAFEMSQANLQKFVERIRQFRPRMLFGYPSSLALIAQFAGEQGIALDGLGIRVAFVTSERLYEHQREAIERAFGCPVANGYGGRDAGFIAHACPQGSLHITSEDMVVEIVDTAGKVVPAGESGEIVVTHLFTSEFPFVRYRTGDVGTLSDRPCACGRGLPVLASVEGRTTDFVTAADGTILHGLALIYVLRDMPGVANFRIVQESLELTRVEVVPREILTEGMVGEIRQGLQARLGQGVAIEVNEVDAIAREQSGKFRYVVSRVTNS
ncbi:MAG: AMP-binding protein [Haliea sp.]|uniref:phenylacetate--CoA ligase family protein n=1 Tax=Haliea sp. TaxID=1932666 RepID=UPI0032ECE700